MDFLIRLAALDDVDELRRLIDSSVRGLQAADYTPSQLERALATVYGVDTQLIRDGTYFAAELAESKEIVGCGGWSKRRTLYGGDQWSQREDSLLNPANGAAKVRAFFVHPRWARRGVGGLILDACETVAFAAGFTRLEMGATLTGVPFYSACGYRAAEPAEVPLGDGESLPILRMVKDV
jgi:GNAT superfamily N-acetyltransferase